MKCRGFQYEVGKEYEQKGEIRCCKNGFHFCENSFDALDYYNPATSRYCKVEGEGKIDKGIKKVAVSHIHIGDELNWPSFINACVKFIFDKVNWNSVHMINNDNYSVAKNNCVYSVAMNAGFKSVATNTGDCSVATNSGHKSVSINTGDNSTAKVGYKDSVAIVIGKNCKAAGVLDSWLVLTERDCNSEIVGMKAVKVDGTTIKSDTYYALRNGEIVEVNY